MICSQTSSVTHCFAGVNYFVCFDNCRHGIFASNLSGAVALNVSVTPCFTGIGPGKCSPTLSLILRRIFVGYGKTPFHEMGRYYFPSSGASSGVFSDNDLKFFPSVWPWVWSIFDFRASQQCRCKAICDHGCGPRPCTWSYFVRAAV